MKQLWAAASGEEDEVMGDLHIIDSMSADADESVSTCWLDGRAPVCDVDEASRDSGICLMDATSAGDDTYHDFSFTMFDTSVASEDSFTELKSGSTMTSLPVPTSSPKSTVDESTPRSRVSRILSFDDDVSPPARSRGSFSVHRPSLTGRRRCQRTRPSSDRLPRTSTAVDGDFARKELCPSHVTMPSIISDCIEEADESADLIGDLSQKHVLPLETNLKHADLKTISPHTMAEVLNNVYSDVIEELLIIDCRYPYEYDGGHITGAKNICMRDAVLSELMTADGTSTTSCHASTTSKRTVLIFHCEFSSERAPKLLRFLRNEDRAAHADCYPHLRYPELYLLAGGYKAFYESHSELCSPRAYRPMLHADHAAELRHFRTKSKTFAGDRRHRPVAPRTMSARRHSLVL